MCYEHSRVYIWRGGEWVIQQQLHPPRRIPDEEQSAWRMYTYTIDGDTYGHPFELVTHPRYRCVREE